MNRETRLQPAPEVPRWKPRLGAAGWDELVWIRYLALTDGVVSFRAQFAAIGIISQSGAMGEAILAHADHINLVSMFMSMGNHADIANDLLDYRSRDPAIRCVLLYWSPSAARATSCRSRVA